MFGISFFSVFSAGNSSKPLQLSKHRTQRSKACCTEHLRASHVADYWCACVVFLPTLQFPKLKPLYIFSFVSERFLVTVCVSPNCWHFWLTNQLSKWWSHPLGARKVEKGVGWSGCQWGWGVDWSAEFPSDKFTDKKRRPNGGRGGGLVQEPRHKSPALIAPVYYLWTGGTRNGHSHFSRHTLETIWEFGNILI